MLISISSLVKGPKGFNKVCGGNIIFPSWDIKTRV